MKIKFTPRGIDILKKFTNARIVSFPMMPIQHSIYYSQFIRDGSLRAIWSDLTLGLFVLVGFVANLLLFHDPIELIQLLFCLRAYIMGEVSFHAVTCHLYASRNNEILVVSKT